MVKQDKSINYQEISYIPLDIKNQEQILNKEKYIGDKNRSHFCAVISLGYLDLSLMLTGVSYLFGKPRYMTYIALASSILAVGLTCKHFFDYFRHKKKLRKMKNLEEEVQYEN